MTEPPQKTGQNEGVEQHTLDSASAALDAGDPEALHSSGLAFAATADRLRGLSDEFRNRLGEVESAWQGPGSRAFSETAARIAHRVDELVSTLSEPSYEWLCREMGDALANGQRELRQLRGERDEQPGSSGASRENRSSPQDGQAQQVMNELANTYRQLGDQLRPLAEDAPAPPEPPQLPNSGTGSALLDGASAGADGPQMAGAGHPAQAGGGAVALPAGGVLGKAPKPDLPQETSTTGNAEAHQGTLGRPGSGLPQPAAPVHAAFALAGGALGRSEGSNRKSQVPTERMDAEENEQPGVLGGDKRPAPRTRHARGAQDDLPPEEEQHQSGGEDASSAKSAHAEQAGERASAPAPAPPPPATTSGPTPEPAPAREVAPAAPQPAPAVAHAAPAVAQAHPQVAQAQTAQAQAAAAASPVPHGAGGADTGVSLANTGPPAPPRPVQTPDPPPAHQPPDGAQQNQGSGGGMPPPHGGMGGAGGAGGAGRAGGAADGERNRNTWLTESNDRWENANPSGVLGR